MNDGIGYIIKRWRNRIALLILFFSVTSGSLFSQNDQFERLNKLTLRQAKELLQKESDQIDALEQMASLISMNESTPGIDENSDEEEYEEIYVIKTSDQINEIYIRYLSKIELIQSIQMPTHSLLFFKTDFDIENDIEQYGLPEMRIKKIFFQDGSVMEDAETAVDRIESGDYKINNTKPIDSVNVSVYYHFPADVDQLRFDDKVIHFSGKNGYIALKNIIKNKADFIISDTIYRRIEKVQALNRHGKALIEGESTSLTMPSLEMMHVLYRYNTLLKMIINNITQKKYKNTAKLQQDLIKQTSNLSTEVFKNPEIMVDVSYSFKGLVDCVDIFLRSAETIQVNTVITIKNRYIELKYPDK